MDMCASLHSDIIDKVNYDITEEEDDNKRHKTDNETANVNEGGFSVPSPDNKCKGGIVLQ